MKNVYVGHHTVVVEVFVLDQRWQRDVIVFPNIWWLDPFMGETRPSILCVTQKRAFMPLYIVLGQ